MNDHTRAEVEANVKNLAHLDFMKSKERNLLIKQQNDATRRRDFLRATMIAAQLKELEMAFYERYMASVKKMDEAHARVKAQKPEVVDKINWYTGAVFILADALHTGLLQLKEDTDKYAEDEIYNPFAMLDIQDNMLHLTTWLKCVYLDAPPVLRDEILTQSDRILELCLKNAKSAYNRADKKGGL